MTDMQDNFNQGQPARGAPTRTAADASVAEAAARARAAMTPQQVPIPPPVPPIDYNEFGQVMLNVLTHWDNLKEQRRQQEEAHKPKPPPVTVAKSEPMNIQKGNERVAESATDYKKQFEEEDKAGVPLNVADKPFSLMEKEPIAIITSILTLLAIGAQWFGVTITADELNELVVGLNSMITAGLMLFGIVAGLIARSKVNSPATVAKAKREGNL